MTGKIVELRTRPERLREDQAEQLREALLPFEQLWGAPVSELLGLVDRQTASRNRWTFVMLSPSQNAIVVNYLAKHSKRPIIAMQLWALFFEHLRTDTGEIMLRREEIAEKMGLDADNVSHIMTELVEFGAIIRRREKVGGLKGPGFVRYFMNPRVATHLSGKERDKAQDEAPLLRLIETPSSTV